MARNLILAELICLVARHVLSLYSQSRRAYAPSAGMLYAIEKQKIDYMKEFKTWKLWLHFTGYLGCFVLGGLIVIVPDIVSGFKNETGYSIFTRELFRIPITLGLLYLYTKFILKNLLTFETLRFKNTNILKWGLIGILLPSLVIFIFYISGNFKIIDTNFNINKEIIYAALLKSLGMSIAAGIIEEVVFRGYMVNLLQKKYTFWVAAIVPSLLFTLLHIGGADSFINVLQLLIAGMLVSIMFLFIYKSTGSIWNASIVHFLWNFVILNELISYGKTKYGIDKLVEFDIGQNELFNGGGFGIETSIPAIIVYGLTIVITWKMIKKTAYNKA